MNFKAVITVLTLLTLSGRTFTSPVTKNRKCVVRGHKDSTKNETNIPSINIENNEKFIFDELEPEILNNEECSTQECIEASKMILSSMDTSTDPCEDFYQFTCGNWMSENEKNSSLIQERYMNNNRKLIQVLEGEYKVDEDLSQEDQEYDKKNFEKIKALYNSCMNTEFSVKKESEFIKEFISNKIKQNKDSYKTAAGLTTLINLLSDYSFSFLLYTYFDDDEKTINISGNYEEVGHNQIKDLLSTYDYSKSEISRMINSYDEIGKKISDIYYLESDGPKKTTIKELNKNYPYINWKSYFTKQVEIKGTSYSINDNTPIVNMAPEYLKELNKLLKEINLNQLIDYIECEFLINANIYFETGIRNMIRNFNYDLYLRGKVDYSEVENVEYYELDLKKNYNKFNNEVKQEVCLTAVKTDMEIALVRFLYPMKDLKKINDFSDEILENIKKAMYNRLPQMEWLDEDTRKYAIEKLSKLKKNIGTDYFMDTKSVFNKYKNLEIDSKNFYANLINSGKRFEKETPNDIVLRLKDLLFYQSTINAYYIQNYNSMDLPIGIFQPPFYDNNVPDYINYGSIGSVIGHELTHAYDNTGKMYDAYGDNRDWWTKNDNEEFEEFSQCFIDQYNQYYFEDKKNTKYYANGKYTLNENIADNGGLSRSYEAWRISLNKDLEAAKLNNKKLPGLSNFTIEQLFYISFGQFYCSNETLETNINIIKNNDHSPNKFRVNGAVSNSKYFAKIFNCPSKSSMNPENKCVIW